MDFISRTLAYAPERRVKPLEGCAHSFFDELRDENTRLPLGKPLPPLFDFTAHELNSRPEVLDKLIPRHLKHTFKEGHCGNNSSISTSGGGSDEKNGNSDGTSGEGSSENKGSF